MENIQEILREMRTTDQKRVGSISNSEIETMILQERRLLYAMNKETTVTIDKELAKENEEQLKQRKIQEKDCKLEKLAKVKIAKEICLVEIYSPDITSEKRIFDSHETVEFHHTDWLSGIEHESHLKTTAGKIVEPLFMNSLDALPNPRIDPKGFKQQFFNEYLNTKPFQIDLIGEVGKHLFQVSVILRPRA